MTRNIVQNVLNANATLTIDGFGIPENCPGKAGFNASLTQVEHDEICKQRREAFFTEANLAAFEACCGFLRGATITPNLRGKNSSVSYALKDNTQAWAKAKGNDVTIYEGVFIAAALALEAEKRLIIKPIKAGLGAALNVRRPAA